MTPRVDDAATRPAVPPWRLRLLDQVSSAGAIVLGGLAIYGSRELGFGDSLAQDVIAVTCPLAMLAAVVLRRAPYPARAALFLGSLFMLQALAVVQFGFMLGPI